MDVRHLYESIRYIELNPIRAKIVAELDDYKWSSASGRFTGRQMIQVDCVNHYLEIDDWAEYLSEPIGYEVINKIKANAKYGDPSGDAIFVKMIERLTGQNFKPKVIGRPIHRKD